MNSRFGIKVLLATVGLCVVFATAFAQGFPVKPITLIVPYPGGGPTDVTMRAMADVAAKHLAAR